MKEDNALWVVGHKITPITVSGNYDMVLGESQSGIPGPPPHYHKKYAELFMILEGELEFVIDGNVKILKTGEIIDLTPGTLHTFSNKAERVCKWINIHSPKGFLSFFEDIGVSANEGNGMAESLGKSIIERVLAESSNYDMHIKL